MALTRKMLNAMGIEPDKIDQIIESHTETVDGLKQKAEEIRQEAAKVPTLEQEIEKMRAEQPSEDWQKKYDQLKAEFDTYKEQIANDQAQREKAQLYRSMLKEIGIDERRLDSIMKVTDLSGVAVEDGAIVDVDTVKQAVANEWGDFITHTNTQGANVDNPPSSTGAKMTRDQIMSIKDTRERQQAIADNIDLFR